MVKNLARSGDWREGTRNGLFTGQPEQLSQRFRDADLSPEDSDQSKQFTAYGEAFWGLHLLSVRQIGVKKSKLGSSRHPSSMRRAMVYGCIGNKPTPDEPR